MSNKLAILVPTCNRPETVREVLHFSATYLKNNGVDIYYYDSSETSLTEEMIREMNDQKYDNVHYIPVLDSLSYGEKIDLLFSRYGIEKEYDYIWPMKDRVICNEKMLRMVLARCDGEADVIISLGLGDIYEGDRCDLYLPVDLYRLFGKQTTSLETVIYNTNTILNGYKFGECEAAPSHRNNFWQFDVLYRRLSLLERPVIGIVSKADAYNINTSEKVESYWSEKIFEVWIEEWIRENFELPDIYSKDKLFVIKDTASIMELLGNYKRFEKLHSQGMFNFETFKKYEGMWEYVTNIPVDELRKLSLS